MFGFVLVRGHFPGIGARARSRPPASRPAAVILAIAALAALALPAQARPDARTAAEGNTPAALRTPARPTLALLDPVDVGPQATSPNLGDRLRILLRESGRFQVMGREEQEARLRDYQLDPAAPCKEFQCGFDAGSVLQAEYVLFGSVTELGNLYSYTFNLLHMATSQVVHSAVGEVARRNGGDPAHALMGRLETLLGGMDPARLSRAVRPKQGLMAVLDLSESSPASRAMAERVTTHAYGSRRFDVMSRAELDDLIKALGLGRRDGSVPQEAELLEMGERLGVSHLVLSRLAPKGREWGFRLALYDIRARRKVREWPAESKDLRKLLRFEDRFFSALTGGEGLPVAAPERSGPGPFRIGLTLAGVAAAGALGYLAWDANQEAEREYALSKTAMGPQAVAARERTEEKDEESLVLGGLGALSLGLSVVLIAF